MLSIYQTNQFQKLVRAKQNGTLRYWTKQEILDQVESIIATQQGDAVIVRAVVQTLGSDIISVTTLSDSGGLQVLNA